MQIWIWVSVKVEIRALRAPTVLTSFWMVWMVVARGWGRGGGSH